MTYHRSILTASMFFALCAMAKDKAAATINSTPKKTLHPLMHLMLAEMTALQPYMVSQARFVAKENRSTIERHLESLALLSAKVMEQKSLQKIFLQ